MELDQRLRRSGGGDRSTERGGKATGAYLELFGGEGGGDGGELEAGDEGAGEGVAEVGQGRVAEGDYIGRQVGRQRSTSYPVHPTPALAPV